MTTLNAFSCQRKKLLCGQKDVNYIENVAETMLLRKHLPYPIASAYKLGIKLKSMKVIKINAEMLNFCADHLLSCISQYRCLRNV